MSANPSKPSLWLLNDKSTPVNHKLAAEIGLNESIMLRQIHYWIDISHNFRDGHWWTYQSVRDMKDKAFPFWSASTINRTIKKLEDANLIIVGNYNKRKSDKTRWLALNEKGINALNTAGITYDGTKPSRKPLSQNDTDLCQNETTLSQNDTDLCQNETTLPESTESTQKKTQRKDSTASDDAVDDAIADDESQGKPDENEHSEPEQSGNKRDLIFDAIKAGWGVDQGSLIGRIKKLLTGNYTPTGVKSKDNRNRPWIDANIEPGMDADEVQDFVRWYRAHNESASFPLSPEKIQLHVYKFRTNPSLPEDNEPVPESHLIFRADEQPEGRYKARVDEVNDMLMQLFDAEYATGQKFTAGDD